MAVKRDSGFSVPMQAACFDTDVWELHLSGEGGTAGTDGGLSDTDPSCVFWEEVFLFIVRKKHLQENCWDADDYFNSSWDVED